ncbi:AMP-binding protein [Candidatus Binatia bacterium]|jgi:long-chain acyl-CoA synthetase|nr:AMP-binding protein [Candidatus Binatia bacterium]
MSTETAPPIWEIAGVSPDAIALEDHRAQVTWGELERRSNALGRGLESLGLVPGDHVALVVSNRVEFVEALLGGMRAGMVITPVKTSWTPDEIAYLLRDAGSRVVVTDVEPARAAAASVGVPVVDLEQGVGGTPFATWLAAQDPAPLPRDRHGYRLSYTSGTTGRPKGVHRLADGRRPWCEAFAASRAFAAQAGVPADGPHLNVSALFHGAPLAFSLSLLASGCTFRILPRWDADAALTALERGVRSTCMVPTMFRQLLALPEERRRAFHAPELRAVVHGGEPCPQHVKQRMIDWLGPILLEYYGMTEGGLTAATSAEWLARPGTVGTAKLGLRILILGPDGAQLPPGAQGTIHFLPASGKAFEYRKAPEKTAAAYSREGAFTVGDIGYVDADGYLFISGRTADVIVSGGVNVYPAEIEDALARLPGVRDACVVGGPDELRGETPVAFLVLDADGTLPAIESACEASLAGYQRPRRFEIRDELPRDPTGKLLRHVLRAELWAGRESNFAAPAR